MLKQTSKNFKEFFILEFTKELIRSTDKYQEILIKKEVREVLSFHELEKKLREKRERKEREKFGEIVHEKLKKDNERINRLKKEEPLQEFAFNKKPIKQRYLKPGKTELRKPHPQSERTKQGISSPLRIPELMLPKTVRHIKPQPLPGEVDLGKLNNLVKDPLVKEIECNGPDTKIIVRGAMGRKSTSIVLTKEEIDRIIKRFSEAGRIPISTGVFKVVYGSLILSAIISEVIDSKFIIKKMPKPPLRVPFRR
ncbi:MAG: hypothetical protein WDZ69_01945 [Candidatus Pacearchaeota archaeon]